MTSEKEIGLTKLLNLGRTPTAAAEATVVPYIYIAGSTNAINLVLAEETVDGV